MKRTETRESQIPLMRTAVAFPEMNPKEAWLSRMNQVEVLGIGQMQTNVIARIYSDGSIEYNPPSDSLHPPVEGELRIRLEHDHVPHLQMYGGEWIDLGEVTDQLLAEHGLQQFSGF